MSLKVLCIDDSKTIRMIVKKAFRPYDCEVFEAENGAEGLTLAGQHNPDLIVLDITMPVMDGHEMLTKVKASPELKDIPVIMLTAESGKDNVTKIVQMGVKDYMVKPFKDKDLIERVNKILTLEPKQSEGDKGDPSKYFHQDEDIVVLTLPEKITRAVSTEVEGYLEPQIKEKGQSGAKKFILDLGKVNEVNVNLIKLIMLIINSCEKASMKFRIAGSRELARELKEFKETGDLPVYNGIEEAKGAF